MFLSWLGLCLVSARSQALAGGVIVCTALMPAVVCGARAYRGGSSPDSLNGLRLEAAFCLDIISIRTRYRTRIWDEWQARVGQPWCGAGGLEASGEAWPAPAIRISPTIAARRMLAVHRQHSTMLLRMA